MGEKGNPVEVPHSFNVNCKYLPYFIVLYRNLSLECLANLGLFILLQV